MRIAVLNSVAAIAAACLACGEPCNDADAASRVAGNFTVRVDSMSGDCGGVSLPDVLQYQTPSGVQVEGCLGGTSGFSATCRMDAERTCDDGGSFVLDVLFDDDLQRARGTIVRTDGAGAECVADVTLTRL